MSLLSISEYETQARDARGTQIPAGQEPALARQNIDFSAGATQSAAFNSTTTLIRICSDVDCRLEFGENPTADSGSMLLTAGQAEYLGVRGSKTHKLSVIGN